MILQIGERHDVLEYEDDDEIRECILLASQFVLRPGESGKRLRIFQPARHLYQVTFNPLFLIMLMILHL